MSSKLRVWVTPTKRSYAATLTPEGLHSTRTCFYPWELLATKVKQNVKEQDTGHVTPCLLWLGSVDRDGYGRVKIQNVYLKVHRLMWIVRFGLIPDDMVVCHNCDQPGCCRPEHLRLDTSAENIRERTRKGRTACGESQGSHKLTDALVKEMRSLHPQLSYPQLASRFGIAPKTVGGIVRREAWKHVA